MKSLLVAVFTLAVSMGTSANAGNFKFKAVDQSTETKLCVAAAKGGVIGVKSLARKLDLNLEKAQYNTYCNGVSIRRFVNQFAKSSKTESTTAPRLPVKYVAADTTIASQICTSAVVNGLKATEKEYKQISNVYCNGELISHFVRKNKV